MFDFVDPVSLQNELTRAGVICDGQVAASLKRYQQALASLAYLRLKAAGYDTGDYVPLGLSGPELTALATEELARLRKHHRDAREERSAELNR